MMTTIMSPALEYDYRFCFVALLISVPEDLSAIEVILLLLLYVGSVSTFPHCSSYSIVLNSEKSEGCLLN